MRNDLASNWVSVNPVLAQGEMGIESDTLKQKIGDGSSDWITLGYSAQPTTDANLQTLEKTVTGAINEVNNDLSDHVGNILNPHSVTKAQVGLGNVENTSDLTKLTVTEYIQLNTSDKTIIGAINEADTIKTNEVDNSQLAQMPTMTIKGNNEITTGNAEDLTVSEVQTMIQDTTHRFVTDSQISLWNSTAPAIKYYNTQADAITDSSNINVGDKIQTFGGSSVNDGLGGLYLIGSTLSGGGFTIATGKHANFLNSKDLGIGQTWQDMTSQRNLGQTYTNTTGKPIMLYILTGATSGGIVVNGVDLQKGINTNAYAVLYTVVQPGIIYSLRGSFQSWFELR